MKSKVKITTINKTKIIGKVTQNNENEIVLISKKKSITVPKSTIETVEIKKFSILKTLGLGATGLLTMVFIAVGLIF
jgi:sRNA-binding regulator protein Hfq